MSGVLGWNILEDENLLALIAPTKIPFVNYSWGDTSLQNIQKVKDFYQNAPFTWLVKAHTNIDNLKINGFVLDDLVSTEMVLGLYEYIAPIISSNITIITPKSNKELQIGVVTENRRNFRFFLSITNWLTNVFQLLKYSIS